MCTTSIDYANANSAQAGSILLSNCGVYYTQHRYLIKHTYIVRTAVLGVVCSNHLYINLFLHSKYILRYVS